MCGIALIICGIRIDLSAALLHSQSPGPNPEPVSSSNFVFSVDDLEAALRRRGPDSLGSKKVIISSKDQELFSAIEDEDGGAKLLDCANGETCLQVPYSMGQLHFIGATLQLRGRTPVTQPLVDYSGNILIYNGEIFGGIHVESDSNDGEILMKTLGRCCSCSSREHTSACSSSGKGKSSVLDVLSTIKGPWGVIYWQDSSRTLWFGRDAFGRRSLLVHWPTMKDSRFLLSSVSPFSSVDRSSDLGVEDSTNPNFWEELSCGVYSLSMSSSKLYGCLFGEVKKHEWANARLIDLIKWERVSVEPKPEDIYFSCGPDESFVSLPAQNVLSSLRRSVMLRMSLHKNFQAGISDSGQEELVPMAVLFSGGLDSMILAALLDECLDTSYGIDLLNVSFDGQFAPDRISAKGGVEELRRIAPLRRWKLVEIDADLSKLTLEMKHVMSLINPANTYMDLNIGIALWLAARGYGWVSEGTGNNNDENQQRIRYKSKARIVLVGSGADEQCAGYGRHKTKYRCGSWLGLNEEMKLDMQRIWKRNMGRDDRCISDNGKEARFPFLDEDVIRTLLDIPLWEVANLNQPSGTGDKKILREVAKLLCLHEAAALPKRAIQFGSRIARESNRKNFGSNRAANQASAGSVVINMP
ncbi:hypothetical protein P3X46_002840 [Hevea brasiliensis]|uniref:Asparagine synthetase domain-containing protein n=1 Tax=Hevea brasiliensis TaxID=3981 RepID=A0ABQ9N589_HEVBR|nr:uncharacterized protein LOC110632482 isoform X1 [Hevea brasiliensis]KAJ9187379.1 hypothetical protein P3X46_002840 [Hevea brasiliensis]